MSILYRPQRSLLCEAMEKLKEFSTVKEMLEYIVEEHEKGPELTEEWEYYHFP